MNIRVSFAVAIVALLIQQWAAGADSELRAIVISIDGLMPTSYTDAGVAKTPVLRSMADNGAYADGVTGVVPTVTYPSHTTLITGVPPAVHGIADNRYLDPEDLSAGGWRWYASDIRKFALRTSRLTLTLVHIADTDGAQHRYGPGSAEAIASYEQADIYVGEIRQTLIDAGAADSTYVVVVSDHGFLPIRHQLHPNYLLKQQGLLTTNDAGQVIAWRADVLASGGSGFVFVKDETDDATRVQVERIIADLTADRAHGIGTIWSAADLARSEGTPERCHRISPRGRSYRSPRAAQRPLWQSMARESRVSTGTQVAQVTT